MKKAILILSLLSATFSVSAYESDTHFDIMYHLSRSVGLNDGMAKMFALANQHIDEGIISSPMLLTVQRQLFHFPGDIEKIEVEGHGAISIPATLLKSKLALAERNSAIGNYLIYLGLKKGDLTLIGLGMHVKMDTYGHAGHSNLLGHMEAGHNPDRAFLETKKYEDMIRSIVQSLVAVKQLLPTEAIDDRSALKYLNKFAKQHTHLARDMTVEDLKDATKISGVLLSDMELQNIYRENMFKKYEYKKLALEKIYEKFLREKAIKENISFNELFPEYLIHDPRLGVKDIIKYVIVTTTDADFLKSEGGKEIFNIQKLFGFQSEDIFMRKFKLEVDRMEFRLNQLFFDQKKLLAAGVEYQVDIGQWEAVIDAFNTDVRETMERGEKPRFSDVTLFLASRYGISTAKVRSLYYMNQRIAEEREQLLKGVGPSGNFVEGSADFIRMRARELGETRIAEEIAVKLTKDLIPTERTEYNKQNFEGETTNRRFEKNYKATAYRLHRMKNWGVNFVHGTGEAGMVMKFKVAFVRFKAFITKNAGPQKIEEWSKLAFDAATKLMEIAPEMAAIDKAETVGLTKQMKRDAFFKLLRYVGPAIFPWFYGQKSAYSYLRSLIANAKLVAKDHEIEDMRLAAEEGKYAKNLLAADKSKKAAQFIRSINRPALILKCKNLLR